MNIIVSILIGIAGLWLFNLSQTSKTITWFGWVLFAGCAFSALFAVDVFTGSLLEHEAQAAWMGLGLFGLTSVLLAVLGWRFGVYSKAAEREDV